MAIIPAANRPSEIEHKKYSRRGCNGQRLAALREFAGQSVLDAGCGNGQYVRMLADQYDIHGVDCDSYVQWDEMPERFSVQDVCHLPHADGSFDTICCFEVLEHLPEPENVLADFYRICRKNVIFTVPNCDISPGMKAANLAHSHWTDPTHVNFFELADAAELCRRAGFRIVKSDYINRMNLTSLIEEAYDFNGVLGRCLKKILQHRERRFYDLTCLVVGEK